MKSFKCQNIFIINPEVNEYGNNICLQKKIRKLKTRIQSRSWGPDRNRFCAPPETCSRSFFPIGPNVTSQRNPD